MTIYEMQAREHNQISEDIGANYTAQGMQLRDQLNDYVKGLPADQAAALDDMIGSVIARAEEAGYSTGYSDGIKMGAACFKEAM